MDNENLIAVSDIEEDEKTIDFSSDLIKIMIAILNEAFNDIHESGSNLERNARSLGQSFRELGSFLVFAELGIYILQIQKGNEEAASAFNYDGMFDFERVIRGIIGSVDVGAGMFGVGYVTGKLVTLFVRKSRDCWAAAATILGRCVAGFNIASALLRAISSECRGEVMASMLDAIGGFLILTKVFAPLAIPLGLLSTFSRRADAAFRNGQYFLGFMNMGVGILAITVLGIFVKSINTAILTIFGYLASMYTSILLTNPFTIGAGLLIIFAILVAIELIVSAIKPSVLRILSNANFRVFRRATGGFPERNEFFIAREAGPEIVGTINGRNAVVNNDQIVEGVSRGVHIAFRTALQKNNSKSRYTARVFLNGKQIAMANAV